jgi:hypothetical protein
MRGGVDIPPVHVPQFARGCFPVEKTLMRGGVDIPPVHVPQFARGCFPVSTRDEVGFKGI